MSDISAKLTHFRFGPYVPLLRSDQRVVVDAKGVVDYYQEKDPVAKKLLSEILPDDSILDAPSMVVPLLLKKKTIWPPRLENDESNNQESTEKEIERSVEVLNGSKEDDGGDDEEIQLVKIVDRSSEVKSNSTPKKLKDVGDYVQMAVVKKLSNSPETTLAIDNYYQSTASDLLLSVGLSQVQEFVLEDRCKRLSSKVKRGALHLIDEAEDVKSQLNIVRLSNKSFKADSIYRCPHCPYKSTSRLVLEGHLEKPHKSNSKTYICNWCNFKTKDKNQIIYHAYVAHHKRSYIEKPVPTHCCRYCDFEHNSKARYTQHIIRCEREFNHESVQAPQNLDDHPGVTPKLITQEDIKAYESILKDLRLAAYNPHQIEVTAHDSQNSIYLIPRGPISIKPIVSQASISQLSSPFTSNPNSLATKLPLSDPRLDQLHQLTHKLMATGASSHNIAVNRGTLLQHPKPTSNFMSGIFAVKQAENVVMAPANTLICNGQQRLLDPSTRARKSSTNSNSHKFKQANVMYDDEAGDHEEGKISNDSFVICEICDTYIEGFSEFSIHMLEAHQVKIRRKLLTSRPPLSCQRCQWRFFTDQGLERHLLGSHGLVTASMQDKADKQIDSGRCTICGRKFSKRLVSHVKDSHKVNLKPAQISYKCKVCSATYALYSHFENHVYQVHPES